MSIEQNKLIMYRMISEIWNQGHYEVADELFAAQHTSPSAPDLPPGPEGVKVLARMFHKAMPDYHMRIDMIVADKTQVAARFIQSGTHTGAPLMGLEPSGRQAEWTEIGVLQIEDGQIVRSWYEVDMLGMIQQLNASPTTEDQKKILSHLADELWDKGNYDVVDELFSPDLIDNNPLPGITPGREGYRQAAILMRTAFPDFKIEMLHQLAEGNLAVDHWQGTGTHLDDFLGIPGTGKQIRVDGLGLGRIDPTGRIVERWGQMTAMELMQQIGVMPGADGQLPTVALPEVKGAYKPEAEEINEIVHRYVNQMWNAGDLDAAGELIHSQATTPYQPELPRGAEGAKAFISGFRSAFPDIGYEIEYRVTDGDLVAILARLSGTHEGEFLGVPATGKAVSFEKFSLKKIVEGSILVNWAIIDMLGLFQQLQPDG